MNTIQKLKLSLNESMIIPGDVIDFRVFHGTTFCHLVAAASSCGKKSYGFDTFNGLTVPTKKDLGPSHYYVHTKGLYATSPELIKHNLDKMFKGSGNYSIHKGLPENVESIIPENTRFCFGLLDLYQHKPTEDALNFLWERMNYGGSIFIMNYNNHSYFSADLAVQEFLKKYEDNIIYNEQMLVNGVKQNYILIKCFNPKYKPVDWIKYIPAKRKLSIALVLKTGGEVYDYKYVNALTNAIRRNTTIDYELVCLTDNSKGFNSNIDRVIPFKHNYPKWWGKIELFRPDIFEDNRVFYFDLDTIVVDNIDEILNIELDFCGLRDFYHLDSLGSGLMTWFPEKNKQVYEKFVPNATNIIQSYTQGDQRWIDENKSTTIYFQDIFANNIISFKKNCIKSDKSIIMPNKSKIICFHGNPRPHTITEPLFANHWKP